MQGTLPGGPERPPRRSVGKRAAAAAEEAMLAGEPKPAKGAGLAREPAASRRRLKPTDDEERPPADPLPDMLDSGAALGERGSALAGARPIARAARPPMKPKTAAIWTSATRY